MENSANLTKATKRRSRRNNNWPWGWIVRPDDFITLLESVFSNHEGHVWLFNNDLAIIRNPKYFHQLYEGYIKNKPQVKSVRIILSYERLREFLNDQVFKTRFNELPDSDIQKFYFRVIEDVVRTPGTHSLREYLKLFNSFEDQSIAFYTVGEQIIHDEAITIIRPRTFPFVAYDERGIRNLRGIAGDAKMLDPVAVDCAHLLESVFVQPNAFSQLKAVWKRQQKEIKAFKLSPKISLPESVPDPQEDGLQRISNYLTSERSIDLAAFRVVGGYLRFEPKDRNELRNYADQMLQIACDESKWRVLNNTLISGLPGQGKTALAEALASALKASKHLPATLKGVEYKEFRLDDYGQDEMISFLREVKQLLADGNLVVAVIDEVDSKETEKWPLELLNKPLQWNEKEGEPVLWFAVGSKGRDLDEFLSRLQARHKGIDFISRFPRHRLRIPNVDPAELLVIACSRILFHASQKGLTIDEIQATALLYFASSVDARQVNDRVLLAVGEVKKASTRLHYDNCFLAGVAEKETFRMTHQSYYDLLKDKYISLRG